MEESEAQADANASSGFYTPTLVKELVRELVLSKGSYLVDPFGNEWNKQPCAGYVSISDNILSPNAAAALCIAESRARTRLHVAAYALRAATTPEERREAAREFLAVLAELVTCLLAFLVRLLMRLLSGLLGRATADDVPMWAPVPLERTPQVTPRGPNPAFPVNTHRGGHHRSTLGSVVLAA